MKNKKGFTLVELLAVIVILAVLVLLAVPSVIKMMDNSKKNAFEVEANSLASSAKLAYAQDMLDGTIGDRTAVTIDSGLETQHTAYCYDATDLTNFVDKTFDEAAKLGVLVDPTNNTYKVFYYDGTYYAAGQNSGEIVPATTGTATNYGTCSAS